MNYNNMRGMMDERAAICSSNGSVCPPVSWTISIRLATLAPFVLRWHYRWYTSRYFLTTYKNLLLTVLSLEMCPWFKGHARHEQCL